MRVAVHTGKGGVGKTTVAAATALAAARAGHRTLLLSTDPAHSVADVLGVTVGAKPTAVGGVDRLWAAQVDTRARFEQAWGQIRSYLVAVMAARGMADVEAQELTALPGADEIVALLEVARYAAGGEFDALIVDCAPTGETLRLLALPETLRFYSERLQGTPARLMRTIAAGFKPLGRPLTGFGQKNGPVDVASPATGGGFADLFGDLLKDLSGARDLLSDNETTGVRIVVTAEEVVIAEARRLRTAMALHGFAVEAVVMNRVLPASADGEFVEAWRARQAVGLQRAAESFTGIPTLTACLTTAEPVGVAALTAFGDELFGGDDPMGLRPAGPGLRTEGESGSYRLLVDLPHADRGAIELGRAGTDLIITVGPHRRRIALPSLLQRCRTTGAQFENDVLAVEFEPDPQLWPAVLSGAR